MDILKINSINNSYIFLNDNIREITKRQIIIDIFPLIKNKVEFYDKMLNELNELYKNQYSILENMECPEESTCQGITGINNLIKREAYLRYETEISGINKSCNYAFKNYNHWYKLLNEITSLKLIA